MKEKYAVIKKSSSRYEMDMCEGPIFKKIIIFAVPVIFSFLLQRLYNAADMVVVGRFASSEALAAVGSTTQLIGLVLSIFSGLALGTNVLTANYYGAGQKEKVSDIVHTSIAFSAVGGVVFMLFGMLCSKRMLVMMGTPENILEQADLYMKIYFAGTPVSMVYNYAGGILRAVGDTKHPMRYLIISGLVNLVLNLIFVIGFSWDVVGVAAATVISQAIAAVLIIRCLMRADGFCRFEFKKLKIVPEILWNMSKIGLPASFEAITCSITNVAVQSSVNSFGTYVIAGDVAAGNVESFVIYLMESFGTVAINFTAQNYGAVKYRRIGKVTCICLGIVFVIGLVGGNGIYFFADTLLKIFATDIAVIEYGKIRMGVVCTTYFLSGMMSVMACVLRGMGQNTLPMAVSLFGLCVFRVSWIYTVFRKFGTLEVLYMQYPISYLITFLAQLTCFIIVYRKLLKKQG